MRPTNLKKLSSLGKKILEAVFLVQYGEMWAVAAYLKITPLDELRELLIGVNPPVGQISTAHYLAYLIKLTEWLGVVWTLARTDVA